MNIDIATTVKVILVFIALGVIASIFYAVRSINGGKRLEFFHKRQDLIAHGWRLAFLAVLLVFGWLWVFKNAEPVAYRYFPPSPTTTRTPTITLTPTITPTLKETLTPTITETLQYTYTPALPADAQATIQTPVGPDANAVFSPLQFSTQIDKNRLLANPQTSFAIPVTHIYGGYSFDKMAIGVQWTAVWLYEGQIFFMETKAWTLSDGSGGYGYTDCQREANQWLPGNYEVQIFVGSTWKTSGRFTITGSTDGTIEGTVTPAPGTTTPTATSTASATVAP
jgi:type VI secretion system secreted protein VgrG